MVMEQLLDDCNLIEFDCRDDELNDFIINDDAIPFYEKNGFVLIIEPNLSIISDASSAP